MQTIISSREVQPCDCVISINNHNSSEISDKLFLVTSHTLHPTYKRTIKLFVARSKISSINFFQLLSSGLTFVKVSWRIPIIWRIHQIMATELMEIQGNLFRCAPTDALAHCVSQDMAMGKGIAKEFKERFDGVANLKSQKKKVGEIASLQIRSLDAPGGRWIYYMITKERYSHKPTLADFKTTLIALKDKAVADQVKVLSMPRIGCGLDKLDWNIVRQLIIDTFENTGIKINIYSI